MLATLSARTLLASMPRTSASGTWRRTCASLADGGAPDRRSYRVDCLKVTRVLPEFETCLTVRRGVEDVHEAHARNDLTFEEFTGTSYLRIDRVRELQEAGRLDDELRWLLPVEVA
jgi:hypothetical protein